MLGEQLLTQLGELVESPDFQAALSAVQNEQEVLKVLADYGVVTTKAELDAVLHMVPVDGNGEISADDLDAVSGGLSASIRMAKWLAKQIAKWKMRYYSPIY